MATRVRDGEETRRPNGSATMTITASSAPEEPNGEENPEVVGRLRLHGRTMEHANQGVRWTDDVIDNEHLGRKKSKSTFYS